MRISTAVMTLSGIHPDSLIGLPFLVEQPGVGWVAVTEADIDNFPGMYLHHLEGRAMEAVLSPRRGRRHAGGHRASRP